MTTTYTTRNEAIEREIIAAIEANGNTADDYDIDAIADAVLGDHAQGYTVSVNPDDFWKIVAQHERGTSSERQAHGRKLAKARAAAEEAMRVAQVMARSAHAEGVPQTRIAEELGVDRMTVRKWIGRR